MTTPLKIVKHDVQLPNRQDHGKLAFILYNVFTPEECQQWIDLTEKRGYSPALLNYGREQVLVTDVRNNDRCMIDDVDMAQKIFERIKSYVPKEWQTHQVVGLNERLRFLRYDPGQKFDSHYDGSFQRENGSYERSYITLQLYLNEGYTGGETTFVSYEDPAKSVACIPRTGMVLIFEHKLLHESPALIKGRKYAVRTDIMYRPVAPK